MTTSREEIIDLVNRGGKYQLRDENREGMNAYAFVARHIPLDRDIFLKVYPIDEERADIFNEPRFLIEATEQGGFDSNLVRVIDAEKLGDQFVLVAMELVDGGSVFHRISRSPLPTMDAVRLASGILHGVAQLHRSLLVHRDIKPANVLIAHTAGQPIAKLTDFGSVARLADANAVVRASRHSALYVPPEGWEDPSRYCTRSDLYQVGIVLWEMLNGPLPYEDIAHLDRDSRREMDELGVQSIDELDGFNRSKLVDRAIARRARSGRILSLSIKKPYCCRNLTRIINKAINTDPGRRYSTASQMIGDLESLNLPNWECCPDEIGVFSAATWRGWDWRIEPDASQTPDGPVSIRRKRHTTSTWRRWKQLNSISAALRLISES